jgi:hypothetical protein
MAGALTISTLNNDTGVLATQNGMTGIPKAWVNYNLATQTIRSSFNVSSVTYNATGQFTVNFTTAFANAEYAVAGFAQEDSGGGMRVLCGTGTPTASARPLEVRNSANSLNNAAWASAAFFA